MTPRPTAALAALLAGLLGLASAGCNPPPADREEPLEPGTGGSLCFSAFDFNEPVGASVVFDGQACPNPFAPDCNVNAADWPVAHDHTDTDYDGFIEVNTKVAHYRITPPVPPTESDLYVAFEAEGATLDERVVVTVALNPSGTDTDSRAIVVELFAGATAGSNSAQAPHSATEYEWDGASWTPVAALAGFANVSVAWSDADGYWGAELALNLPSVGITGDDFYMATYWASSSPLLSPNAGENWVPQTAYPDPAARLPDSDPTTWLRYSFGEDCAPDVYINSEWNTCADIYINARGDDAKRIGINNSNAFHAVVHGDDDAGAPTANDVLVYLDIGHLGNGNAPYAMNYPHADANINFNGAQFDLDTATPEPPTPFSVAAQATNDDVRLTWRPADEAPNPFADGEHVCVEAYVYFKDDPNFDNNFGQCNMQFVDAVAGRPLSLTWSAGTGFWWPFERPVERVLYMPVVVNSASDVRDWGVEMDAPGMERTNLGWVLAEFGKTDDPDDRDATTGTDVQMRVRVPEEGFEPIRDRRAFLGAGGEARRLTREVYQESPLLIVRSFVPITGRDPDGQPYRVAFPGSYVGFAFRR